ncbi:MAG: hypothetical protein P1P90_06265 [Patescibacteria group bacterium]|nr:hypothetical protein [Patescibacteria group bacterium]
MKIFHQIKARLAPKTGLYKYSNYEEYKQAQIDGNLRKLDCVWSSNTNIEMLTEYIKQNVPNIKFGICHGTRRGEEQALFRKLLNIEVIGTEISHTATQFPHTIEWDFHNVKDEWINNVDFIYSNSFDHSYNPEKCLDAWMSCIAPNGICILEWTRSHAVKTKTDPFGANKKTYEKLISKKYRIKEILSGGITGKDKDQTAVFFIVTHK